MTEVVAFIFARGGSVAVPRKNVREIAGKPLIGHAIECAQQAKLIDRVMVSTDDDEIADVARQFGAEIPFMRPANLAGSDSAELDAWRHAVEYLRSVEFGPVAPEIFVSVPPTSPLRSSTKPSAASINNREFVNTSGCISCVSTAIFNDETP
jgi:CMP-N-acetylneuraminic acid synthetase